MKAKHLILSAVLFAFFAGLSLFAGEATKSGILIDAMCGEMSTKNAEKAAGHKVMSALMGAAQPAPRSYDVGVYGATAGGVAAAVAAARSGATVVLLEPSRHLGGMLTGGLGRTDMDRQQHVIGGLAREFFLQVGKHYAQPIAWMFEPHVAQKILNTWVREAAVDVLFENRLQRVIKDGNHIARIRMENGAEFEAAVFIDASYEGDLMARAGVSYTVGREGKSQYGESFAGVKEIQPGNHQLLVPVSPYDDNGNLLPFRHGPLEWDCATFVHLADLDLGREHADAGLLPDGLGSHQPGLVAMAASSGARRSKAGGGPRVIPAIPR